MQGVSLETFSSIFLFLCCAADGIRYEVRWRKMEEEEV